MLEFIIVASVIAVFLMIYMQRKSAARRGRHLRNKNLCNNSDVED